MYKLFLSYRRDDSIDITGRLADRLRSRYGQESIFMDIYSIPVGVNFKEYINQEVTSSQVLLIIIGHHWIDCSDEQGIRRLDNPDDFVRLEIEAAITNEIPIVPILVGKASMPTSDQLPTSLRSIPSVNAAEVRSGIDFDTHVNRLFETLDNLKKTRVAKKTHSGSPPKKSNKTLAFLVLILAITATVYYSQQNPSLNLSTIQDTLNIGGLGPTMIYIEKASYAMGDLQGDGNKTELPVHQISFTQDFAIGKYEITVSEFAAFINDTGYITQAELGDGCQVWTGTDIEISKTYTWRNPGYTQKTDLPVTCVSHQDAIEYTQWLTQQTGIPYNLPSESQWEYSARGGTKTRFSWGDELDDNTRAAYGLKSPTSIGTYAPNAYGLYNMHGNISEWVLDSWQENYDTALGDGRAVIIPESSEGTIRGGSWISPSANTLRSAKRDGVPKQQASNIIGFRVARRISN